MWRTTHRTRDVKNFSFFTIVIFRSTKELGAFLGHYIGRRTAVHLGTLRVGQIITIINRIRVSDIHNGTAHHVTHEWTDKRNARATGERPRTSIKRTKYIKVIPAACVLAAIHIYHLHYNIYIYINMGIRRQRVRTTSTTRRRILLSGRARARSTLLLGASVHNTDRPPDRTSVDNGTK